MGQGFTGISSILAPPSFTPQPLLSSAHKVRIITELPGQVHGGAI
jgi:hypothetical protein